MLLSMAYNSADERHESFLLTQNVLICDFLFLLNLFWKLFYMLQSNGCLNRSCLFQNGFKRRKKNPH